MKHLWITVKKHLKAEAYLTWVYKHETLGADHYVPYEDFKAMADKYEARIKEISKRADTMIEELKVGLSENR